MTSIDEKDQSGSKLEVTNREVTITIKYAGHYCARQARQSLHDVFELWLDQWPIESAELNLTSKV